MAKLDDLLTYLKTGGGSDLHLAAGQPPRMRAKGRLRAIEGWPALGDEPLLDMLKELATPMFWEIYSKTCDVDFAYALAGVGRFRANYFAQDNGAAAVFRLIPEKIIPFEDLKLPEALVQLTTITEGLVLVTGPTGSGKSTTLAAIIDRVNKTSARHIVTIEDPVEFVHPNIHSVFSHREVGLHTLGFAGALRAAIRQDADVILVGEMREQETISLALAAAEMGMLVFGTLHTNNAAKTVDRIIDAFPAEEQPQVRLQLSEALAAIVAQLLIPKADGSGRVAANEILLRTPGMPNVIREGNTRLLGSIIGAGKGVGMQAMDDVLLTYVREGTITAFDAFVRAVDKKRFEPLLEAEREEAKVA